jgi:nucleoside 2-deoxyribosyltransferase
MKKVYLAGPISITTYDGATEWRIAAAKFLRKHNVEALDPMRGKAYLKDMAAGGVLNDSYDQLNDKYAKQECPLSTGKAITRRDHWDVRSCDIVLFNLGDAKVPSIGSMIELGWASAYRKYIVTVMEEGNPHWHGMVKDLSDLIVPTLKEALTLIVSIAAEKSNGTQEA